MKPNQEFCTSGAYFIASNKTDFSVEAKFKNIQTKNFNGLISVNNPLAVTFNETTTSNVYSKIKCLDKSDGCKLQIASVYPSEVGYFEEPKDEFINILDLRYLSYFSTKASGSFSKKVKYNLSYKKEDDNDKTIVTYNNEVFVYKNINPSKNNKIYLEVKTEGYDTLSNATVFSTESHFSISDADYNKFNEEYYKSGKAKLSIEGDAVVEFEKIGDRPSGSERMLFENDLEVVLLGQDAVKTADQVKEDTKNIEKKNKNFPVWAIAVIVVASVFVLVIIIVVVIICVKKSGRVYGSD